MLRLSQLYQDFQQVQVSVDHSEDRPTKMWLPCKGCAKLCCMERDEVIATLRAHEPELRAAGVVRLSLFGSTARNEARADSDVDLLAAFDDAHRLSLLDLIGIENRLADLLGHTVDLIEEGTLKPRAQQNVSREAVLAF